ncbi:TPA: NAD(P)-dependent oxidoreductase [Vibrio vulnificus]|nr:NAD(P)-dependent oxidoreductase [Vibrio vulnificus]
MKILVTGGSGMLGSAILRMFHQQHELHFTARNTVIAKQLTDQFNVTPHLLNLEDKSAVYDVCQGIDGIIHCAALSSPWGKWEAFYQSNVDTTKNLISAANAHQVSRFIHISSTSVYFDYKDRWNIRETDDIASRWCNDYARTKYLSELEAIQGQSKTIILRPRGIFGPNDRAIIPRVLKAIKNDTLLLPSGRNPVVDLTYVDNVAHAAMLACTQAEQLQHGDIFNISNNEPMPIETVLRALCEALNINVKLISLPYRLVLPLLKLSEQIRIRLPYQPEPKLTSYSAGLFNYHQTLDISKAQKKLNYQPLFSVQEGIQQYADWSKNKNL